MDKNKIQNRLEPMVGSQYLISGFAERIIDYKFEQSSVKVITDKRVRVFDEAQLEDFVRHSCMPMDEDFKELNHPVVNQNEGGNTPARQENVISYKPSFSNQHFSDLRKVLMDNIEKVQNDKGYLDQAVAVRDNVQSVIELTKNEIEFMKTVSRLKR